MKRKCAVLTMARNENVFLPIWLNYYSKFFPIQDIYVLDHLTDDGSTENINCNVVKLDYELAWDAFWRVSVIQSKVSELLNTYECVIFTDTDEIIFSEKNPLNKIIDDFILSDKNYITCKGYEVMQNESEEQPFNNHLPIFKQRSYWFQYEHYNKTLITKTPQYWSLGFHSIGNPPDFYFDVYLIHLHRFDWQSMLKRHIEAYNWKQKERDSGIDFQYFLNEEKQIKEYFNTYVSKLELIPTEIKNQLLKIGV